MTDKVKQPSPDITKLRQEIEETYRGVLELVVEMGNPADTKELSKLRQEVGRLSIELDETYRGVIELATSLERDEQKFKFLTESAGLGLWEWSLADNSLQVNEEWLSITGLTRNDFGETLAEWESLVHPDDMPKLKQERTKLINGERLFIQTEHRIKTASGDWQWVLCLAKTPVSQRGHRPRHIAGMLLNIDSQKRAELKIRQLNDELEQRNLDRTREIETINRQLLEEVRRHQHTVHALRQAKQAADAANQAKSTFLANMSHELRTPLQTILGFSQLMQHDPDLSSQQIKNLEAINSSGSHLYELINNILEISEVESGRLETRHEEFNLLAIIEEIESIFRLHIDKKQLHLNIAIAAAIPQCMSGDITKLRQILINLLGNAVKFTDNGGISLSVDWAKPKHSLRFVVEDTGPGIPDGEMAQLFQPFAQGVAGITKGGTGLGLVITRQYVQLLGGKLTVNSTPGKGSRFSFTLPFNPAPQTTTPEQNSTNLAIGLKSGKHSRLAMVIDSHRTSHTLLCQMLLKTGFDTLQANNPELAIKKLRKHQADLILLTMPAGDLNDRAVIATLRQATTYKQTPIVVISSNPFLYNQELISEYGADALLIKPYRLQDLTHCLGTLLDVEFIYQNNDQQNTVTPPPPSNRAVAMLAEEMRLRLHDAAMAGDIGQLRACIEDIYQTDQALAASIGDLADRFDYDTLLEVLH